MQVELEATHSKNVLHPKYNQTWQSILGLAMDLLHFVPDAWAAGANGRLQRANTNMPLILDAGITLIYPKEIFTCLAKDF